jgi:uncharacterized membrane protein (DUF4010 family)
MVESLTPELIEKVVLALAIGALMGTERQHTKRQLVAGVRTFALVTLMGALFVEFAKLTGSSLAPVVGFVAVLVFAAILYWSNIQTFKTIGLTTTIELLLAFVIGLLVGYGRLGEAIFITLAVVIVLFAGTKLHAMVSRVTHSELLDFLEFLALLGIVYPILPAAPLVYYGVHVDLLELWYLIVLLAAVHFIGFIASRYFGSISRYALLSFLGGVANATAAIYSLTDLYRHEKQKSKLVQAGFMFATAGMMLRNTFLIAIVFPAILKPLALPVLVSVALLIGLANITLNSARPSRITSIESPFGVARAAGLAIKLFALLIVLRLVTQYIPDVFYLATFLGGMISGAATAVSIASLVNSGAVLLAAAAVAQSFSFLGDALSSFAVLWLARAGEAAKQLVIPIAFVAAVYAGLLYFTLGL